MLKRIPLHRKAFAVHPALRASENRSRQPLPAPPAVILEQKAALLQRLRAMKARGLSLQAIANQLNAEGVPTLSGRGRWQKGTTANLLAQGEE